MKNKEIFTIAMALMMSVSAFSQADGKLKSSKSHIKFYSHTAFEDIEADNYASISTLDINTGDIMFSVPMQAFGFEKSMMQRHFNNDQYLDTRNYPNARLVGKITNLDSIDFSRDGAYEAIVEAELTIKGKTNPLKEKGTITIKGRGITVHSVFRITLAD